MYANDTALVFSGCSWEEVREIAVRGFKKVKNWLETFKLSLNETKTNYIAFSITNTNRPTFKEINVSNDITNFEIKGVKRVKYF